MIKKFLTFSSYIFALLFFVSITNAENIPSITDYEHIDYYITYIQINKNGTIDVTEEIKYFFDVPRHGIFRDIPYTKTNLEGKKFKFDISNISVTDKNQNPYQYTQSKENENIRLKIGDPDSTITGYHTYLISYKVAGAITYFSDHDELYWNAVGTDWDVPVLKSEVRVSTGEGLSYDIIPKINCFYGPKGSTNIAPCEKMQDDFYKDHTAQLNEVLMENEGFTAVFWLEKGMVDVLEPEPDNSWIFAMIFFLVVCIVLIYFYVILPFTIFLKWYRDYSLSKNARIVSAWFSPPKSDKGRELTPAETSLLVDKNVDIKDITATVIQLAQKGFLKIKQGDKGDFELIKQDWSNSKSGITKFENLLLDTLFATGVVLNMKNLKSSSNVFKMSQFKKMVSEKSLKYGYFKEDPNKTWNKYTGIGATGLFFLNFLLGLSAFIFGRKSARRTEKGIEKYGEAMSLRNFLTSQEDQLEFQAKNQMMFEKLLPYAIAFGVEKIWADRFKDLDMTNPDWYEGDFKGSYTYSSFSSSLTKGFVAATAVSMSSSYSSSGFSSGFSGGGSSGGGGGGGGGGSW